MAPGVSGRTLYHPLTLPDEVFPPSNLKPDSEKADMREVILPRPVDFPAPQTHGTSSSLIQRVSHPVSLISKPSTTSSFGTIAFLVLSSLSCHLPIPPRIQQKLINATYHLRALFAVCDLLISNHWLLSSSSSTIVRCHPRSLVIAFGFL